MLGNALDILRLLAESPEPLTATAIAERIGLHTSNVSRTLRVLKEAGYVRKPSYHSFAPDLGLLALAGSMATHHPLCTRTRSVARRAADHLGLQVTLAGLFREQIVYLQRCSPGNEPVSAGITSWPLHRSVVALRLLLDLDEEQALAQLEASRRRYGWERPTAVTPASPKACLRSARKAYDGRCLWLRGWNSPERDQAAVAIAVPGQVPLALAVDGVISSHDHTAGALQEAAGWLQEALNEDIA